VLIRRLYREILKNVRTYPSKNRDLFRTAIMEEIQEWKQIKDPLE